MKFRKRHFEIFQCDVIVTDEYGNERKCGNDVLAIVFSEKRPNLKKRICTVCMAERQKKQKGIGKYRNNIIETTVRY